MTARPCQGAFASAALVFSPSGPAEQHLAALSPQNDPRQGRLPVPSRRRVPPSWTAGFLGLECEAMGTTAKSTMVTGLFPDRDSAERAYSDISARGYRQTT